MFHSYFERRNNKLLRFNIVHVPNFEISTSLLLAPHLAVSEFNKHLERLLVEMRYIILLHYKSFPSVI